MDTNKKNKIKCPYCGSTNVVFWREFNYTRYYKLDKNGKPKEKPYAEANTGVSMPSGLQCENCNCYNSEYEEEFNDWGSDL